MNNTALRFSQFIYLTGTDIQQSFNSYLFQKAGEKIIRIVKSSNLPINIKKDKNHLPKSGRCEKF